MSWWLRAYRLVLRLYPEPFRRRYGEDMESLYVEAVGSSRAARWATVRGLVDGLAGAWRERARVRRIEGTTREGRMRAFADRRRQDVHYALRRLRAAPAFTAMIVLTLALGIGANTAIFSVVNAVLLRPLPFPDPEQLVDVRHVYDGSFEAHVSAPGYREYAQTVAGLQGLAARTDWSANLTEIGAPEFVRAARVSANYHRVFGVAPVLGRDFRAGEDAPGADRVAVISEGFWTRRLGSSPGVLGTTIRLNGEAYEIVGVMPRGYVDAYDAEVELWVPLAFTPQQLSGSWQNEWLRTVGRLKPGGTVASLNAELAAKADRLRVAEDLPGVWSVRAKALREAKAAQTVSISSIGRADVQPALLILLGAVGLVLLIACANVANLLLARASVRAKEIAIRAALGAGRRRIAGQLLTESLVLSLAGGALGLLIAAASVRVLGLGLPRWVQLAIDVGIDGPVLAFAALLAVGTGLVFGLAPALQLMRTDVQHTLREGGRSGRADRAGHWLRRTLVAGEIALAITLLTGAGLLVRSFSNLQAVDPGFEPAGLLTFQLFLPDAQYPTNTARIAFFDRALEAVGAVPGVESAAAISVLPFGGGWSTASFDVEGYTPGPDEQPPWGDLRTVSPGYFETMGIPLISGRTFEGGDDLGDTGVAVIDEVLAQRYFAGRDPIGLHLGFGDMADPETPRYRIVGVVGHTAHESLDDGERIQFYRTYRQQNRSSMAIVVRTRLRPTSVVGAVRAAVQSVDPAMPLARVAEMESLVAGSVGQRRLSTVLLASFALLALVLACLGIYGVMSYVVTQRRQEIGVRIALGARAGTVVRLFLRQGVVLVGAGLTLGVAGAFGLTRVLRSQLFGVEATDPATFVAAALVLVATAFLATWLPAHRAARLDPVHALRDE